MVKKVNIQFKLPVSILREGKRFIAYTPALDLSTSGRSYEEAKKRFEEIVEIFFDEIIKRGTVDQVLQDMGWHKAQKHWNPPVVVAHDTQVFRVMGHS